MDSFSVSIEKSYAAPAIVILNLFRDSTVFKLADPDMIGNDFEEGGSFFLSFSNRGEIDGTFIKITENEIVLEWNVEGFGRPPEINTRVEITFSNENERCILKLDHKNIMHEEAAKAKHKAWTEILDAIETRIWTTGNFF